MNESEETDEELDLNNEKFWNKIHESFQLASELIKEMAVEMGIDLNSIKNNDTTAEQKEIEHQIRSHPLVVAGMQYAKIAEDWMREYKELFTYKYEQIHFTEAIGFNLKVDEEETLEYRDLLEVIRWYQIFIGAKLSRAMSGLLNGFELESDDYPKDSDGSAKIAMIAIERSIDAWGGLLNSFPQMEDGLLDILVHLTKLLKETEKIFPEARAFIRPGFDE